MIRFLRLTVFAAFLLAVTGGAVRADFITLPVKWSQPIVYTTLPAGGTVIDGVDLLSNHLLGIVRADDFISDGRPITAVRWWGSYPEFEPRHSPAGFAVPFDISFHLSIPGSPEPHPFSLPAPEPIYFASVLAQEVFVGLDITGYPVYRYDAYLPAPFAEVKGVEYFIDIDKPVQQEFWGWHTTTGVFDYHAFGPTHGGPWATYMDPPSHLAFELMTPVPEPSTYALLALGLTCLAFARRRLRA